MNLQQAQTGLTTAIRHLYDDREAALISDWVLEQVTGLRKIDRILQKDQLLSPAQDSQLQQYTTELVAGRPVQYVLHESWFMGMKFYVDEHVLIPRPETEELVETVIDSVRQATIPQQGSIHQHSILDVGTGSGCIAIALQKHLPDTRVYACDVSLGALNVAKQNAATNQTPVQFLEVDFLDPQQRASLPRFQTIVSNPPYIPLREKPTMAKHVVDFEPHLALFVEDGDPLVFYHALGAFAREHLLPNGLLAMEIHEDLAAGVAGSLQQSGFTTINIKKDLQGKDRIIKATW